MSLKEWIDDMPFFLKLVLVVLFIIGLILIISGMIVSSSRPYTHGREDVVCAETGDCLNGIGMGFLSADVLFIIAYACARSPWYGWFLAICKWLCILCGIFVIIGGTIWSAVLASNNIKEYDRVNDKKVSIVLSYENTDMMFVEH